MSLAEKVPGPVTSKIVTELLDNMNGMVELLTLLYRLDKVSAVTLAIELHRRCDSSNEDGMRGAIEEFFRSQDVLATCDHCVLPLALGSHDHSGT